MQTKLILFTAAFFSLLSCKKNDSNLPDTKPSLSTFNFNTAKNAIFEIALLSNKNQPLKNIPIAVYANENGEKGDLLFKSVTDANGQANFTANLPAYMDTVIVDPNIVGLAMNVKVYSKSNKFSCTIGGNNHLAGNIVFSNINPPVFKQPSKSNFDINGVKTATVFEYAYTSATSAGVPNNLESTKETITADMLSYLNYSIPEGKSVVALRPYYLSNTSTSNIVIKEQSDVWITFVTATTAAKSPLGYYTYSTNNPPKTLADISKITFLIPNANIGPSRGGMAQGSMIKLGRFEAGTTIGFVIYANGWAGGGSVNTSATAYFTDSYLNPEKNAANRKHTVLLNYKDELYFVGFDDGNRDGGADNDFNDIVITAKSNPVTAIDRTQVDLAEAPVDKDNDGVLDIFDEYPTDPLRAYNNYYPGINTWGTLAFEDEWPNYGDYDLNDLVVRYRYQYVTNAQGRVVELFGNYVPIAAGAIYKDGFGVQFPFSSSLIQSVTGQVLSSNYIKTNSNGTEAGQSKAVIIPFDNYSALTGGSFLVNTDKSRPVIKSDTAFVKVNFTSPITTTTLGIASLNPFLISDMRRGYEVHLPQKSPTDLADKSLLGTGIDYYNAANGISYISKDNYPWALSFTETFNYPKEKSNIKDAFLNFINWANSGGTSFTDWYKNTAAGYRNSQHIY